MVHSDPFGPLLARLGLTTETAVKQCQGELVKNHRGHRDILRLQAPNDSGRPQVLYLKRIWRQNLKDGLRSLLRHGRVWSVSKTEWVNTQCLQRAGFKTAALVAYGEECGWFRERFSFLLTCAVPAPQTLEDFLRDCRQAPIRRRVLDALAREIRQFHAAGLATPDLYTRHLFVSLENDQPVFYWIDVARLDQGPEVTLTQRARDLAALNISAPLNWVSARERLRFLKAYAGNFDRPLIGRIQARMRHLLKRRKHRGFLSS